MTKVHIFLYIFWILKEFPDKIWDFNAIFIEVTLGSRRTENQIFMSIETHLLAGCSLLKQTSFKNQNNINFSMENTYFKLFCKYEKFKNAFLLTNPPKVVSERIKIK